MLFLLARRHQSIRCLIERLDRDPAGHDLQVGAPLPRFRCKGLDELIRSQRFTLREQRLFQYLIRQINELGRRFECCAVAIIRVDQRRVAEDAERVNERAEQRTLLSELA